MGSIRLETSAASHYVTESLRYAGQIGRMLHNGVDIVLFETPAGAKISIHFIDSAIPLYEIGHTLRDNAAKNIATLYMLWADMMLPYDGQTYRADDWMYALYTLYADTIYGYDIDDGAVFVFPVHFRPIPGTPPGVPLRRVQHGVGLPFDGLTIRTVRTTMTGLDGTWRVADFGGVSGAAHDPHAVTAGELGDSYRVLGIAPGASRQAVRQAYRARARVLHPDVNPHAAAHDDMQALNAAYQRVIARMGDE